LKMLPNLVIIGAQKSASTFLNRWLMDHPQIFLGKGECNAFEDPEYQNFEISQLTRELEPKIKIYGIKRPNYLAHAEIADRIKQHLVNPKVICIIRNPISRAISAYYHYMKYGIIPIKDPDRQLNKILNGDHRPEFSAYQNTLSYGLYGMHLQKYFDLFEAENVHVALMEDIIDEKKGPKAFEQICNFLEVPFLPIPAPNQKFQASIYSLTRLRWRNIANPWIRKYDSIRSKSYPIPAHERKWFSKWIEKLVLSLDGRVLKRMVNTTNSQVRIQTRQRLLEYYLNDITKLERLINQNLDDWKKI